MEDSQYPSVADLADQVVQADVRTQTELGHWSKGTVMTTSMDAPYVATWSQTGPTIAATEHNWIRTLLATAVVAIVGTLGVVTGFALVGPGESGLPVQPPVQPTEATPPPGSPPAEATPPPDGQPAEATPPPEETPTPTPPPDVIEVAEDPSSAPLLQRTINLADLPAGYFQRQFYDFASVGDVGDCLEPGPATFPGFESRSVVGFRDYDRRIQVSSALFTYDPTLSPEELLARYLSISGCGTWTQESGGQLVDFTLEPVDLTLPTLAGDESPFASASAWQRLTLRTSGQSDGPALRVYRLVVTADGAIQVLSVGGDDDEILRRTAEDLGATALDRLLAPADPLFEATFASWQEWAIRVWEGGDRQLAEIDFNVPLEQYGVAYGNFALVLAERTRLLRLHPVPPDRAEDVEQLFGALDDYSANAMAIAAAADNGDRALIDQLIAERAPLAERRDQLTASLGITEAG